MQLHYAAVYRNIITHHRDMHNARSFSARAAPYPTYSAQFVCLPFTDICSKTLYK